ncbi:hypothetical protein [Nostoc sp.]|uniref:hypothetical protein n=1 Tax=Nostoc sp. TaxID=1180 RepID=UPI002FF9EF45
MLIGMAIAPNLATSVNAHQYASTYTVYLDNFSLKSLAYPAKKSYLCMQVGIIVQNYPNLVAIELRSCYTLFLI